MPLRIYGAAMGIGSLTCFVRFRKVTKRNGRNYREAQKKPKFYREEVSDTRALLVMSPLPLETLHQMPRDKKVLLFKEALFPGGHRDEVTSQDLSVLIQWFQEVQRYVGATWWLR